MLLVVVLAGCSETTSSAQQISMSESHTSGHAQYRAFAEAYILRCIDRLDKPAEKRLMDACAGAPYKTAVEALDDFEASESITMEQVEWIQNTWRERTNANPNEDSKAFTAEIANDVFSEIDF